MPRLLHRRRERGPVSDPVVIAGGAAATLLDTYFEEYWLASSYSGSGSWLGEKGVADLALPGGSANPTFCGHSTSLNPFGAGVDYVALPGTSGNYVSTPDAAALDITGDISFVACAIIGDWTPAATDILLAKNDGASSRSYGFALTTAGTLRIDWFTDGSVGTYLSMTSTASVPFTDGTIGWVAASLDVNDGGGNRVAKFWTSTDGTSWTQLGTTVTTAGTTSIFAGTALLNVGAQVNGTLNLWAGSVARAQVYSGVRDFSGTPSGGTLVADFNPAGGTFNTTETTLTGTGDSLTWTINRSTSGRRAWAITRDAWWFGTDDYLSTSGDVDSFDFGASQDFTVAALFRARQDADTAYHYIMSKLDLAVVTNIGWGIGLGGTGVVEEFFGNVDTSVVAHAGAFYDTSWNTPGQLQTNIATRTNGATGNLALYTDATSVATATDPGDAANSFEVNIGARQQAGVRVTYFEGLIYGLGISRTGLTAAQVTTLDTELRSLA